MPTELLSTTGPIQWVATLIRPSSTGIESEFQFHTSNGLLSITIDFVAPPSFTYDLQQIDKVQVLEHSIEERGWIEQGRFELRVQASHDLASSNSIYGSNTSWDATAEKQQQG